MYCAPNPATAVLEILVHGEVRNSAALSHPLHRLPPPLFGDFEVIGRDLVKMATAEKAPFDTLYLGATGGRWFSSLPEIEFPGGFRWKELERYSALIQSPSRRAVVRRNSEALRASAEPRRRRVRRSAAPSSSRTRRAP